MKVTAKQVAEAANVSPSAVSLAFRNHPRQSDKTREMILRVADEMGYRPNLLVDSFRTGKTGMIGVMMELKGGASTRILSGIENSLARYDNVPIVLAPDSATSEESQLHRLLDRRVDGIIMLPHGDAMFEEHLQDIIRRQIPLVVVDNPIKEQNFHPYFVGTDDFEGGRRAAQYLFEQGHRKFGILTTGSYPQPMHFRKEGFESAVKSQDGACAFSMVGLSRDEQDIMETATELLKLEPTAVFCTIDPLLPYIYRAAEELGLKIPSDLSVIGFAGLSLTRYLSPAAATLVQPFERIGSTAVDLLMPQIDGDVPEPAQVRFVPDLDAGHSTAPPAQR